MTINKTLEQNKIIMSLKGRLDTTTAPEFENELSASVGDVAELVLDLSELDYISSAGLRVVLKAQKLMNAKGGMKLVNVNAMVMEVFEITGFVDILDIE